VTKHVRILKPAKTAMQSGRGMTHEWLMVFEPRDRPMPDPVIGWVGSADTGQQVRITFETKEEAVAYARKNGYTYTVHEPKARRIQPKAYADNFAYTRREPWTH